MTKQSLKKQYTDTFRQQLKEELGLGNINSVPKLTKIVLNVGCGEAARDKNKLESVVRDMTAISGQKPVLTRAKKSISNFKLRENQVIGVKVTLRGDRMYDFLERLIHVATPSIPDFRGFPNTAKSHTNGNMTIGLKEQSAFHEVVLDKSIVNFGMAITMVTTATEGKHCEALLLKLGVPLQTEKKAKV
ncbi:MAG: 50S ribosomal protein L5 [Chlamydiia bacterium]|nr:50S ribosomal protein L5 [Chlamydiia bacterium]